MTPIVNFPIPDEFTGSRKLHPNSVLRGEVSHRAERDDAVRACHLTGPLGLSRPTVTHLLEKLAEAG